jgi:hypothetical protein
VCSTACDIKAVLRVDGPTARRAGLTRGSRRVRIGSGSAGFTQARAARVTITLTRSAVRALRKVRRGTLLLDVTVTAGARSTRLSQVQRLRP